MTERTGHDAEMGGHVAPKYPWLAAEAPDRPELKRNRDRRQAEIVQAMLDAEILLEQQGLQSEEERVTAQSEASMRADLQRQGFDGSPERSGALDHAYHGPIVAVTARHVAQDIGRRRIVIHEGRSLDAVPALGSRVEVKFKGGRGTVSELRKPGPDLGR
ncbi:hypothetical protein [Roseateles saccharophilus]|uniref:KfrB domain-containing protein n=1 Tax=Roseateles saccharophilus TaxID=304 RepID=A0A4R3VFQ0_ROSSA|nr:hypothetical protein [Roseateles saccharophilus]MDG0831126.1 hypothetical protein [Roseateles saccharophilus]TCV04247.1 hypothetical protein EV671_10012 [Roseateles saccharophilus]